MTKLLVPRIQRNSIGLVIINNLIFANVGIKILYVEDQIFNQNIIKKILQSEGLTVDLADNGLQGFMKYHVCLNIILLIN